jgi:glycosyltransferase involved in cell wall biosynthesis
VPFISVIIPTRDRPRDIQRCLTSLAQVTYPRIEILLMDQSADGATEAVAGRFASLLPKLKYARASGQGAARARNAAMKASQGEIIAFLDDDCTVGPDWLERVAEAFRQHPGASLVFGRVQPAPATDPADYFVPGYEIPKQQIHRGRLGFLGAGGMAASMYFRRGLYEQAGPIDEQTGAGARFAGEDRDYCYRVLAAGGVVLETPEVCVQHHGARAYRSGAASQLIRRAGYSVGALHMKLLRCGEPIALVLILAELWRSLGRINLPNVLRFRGPTGAAWMAMYVYGLFDSLKYGVDRKHYLWLADADRSP